MIVTKFKYPLETQYLKKVDLMIQRCMQPNPKRDAVMLFEGQEGEGKTTFSIATGYYVAEKTKRVFNHTRVFFDLNKLIYFLKNTEDQIVDWDEPALQSLSKDAMTTIVKNLERLLMMARKKRHFIMINLSYFNKFSDYIVWQRPLGMVHVYSRNELEAGRFVYIKKKNLENLYMDWLKKRQRNYRKYASPYIRGTFPDVLNPDYKNNVLSDFDLKHYEREKDKAIKMIGVTIDKKKEKQELMGLKYKLGILNYPINDKYEMAKQLGLKTYAALNIWKLRYFPKENGVLGTDTTEPYLIREGKLVEIGADGEELEGEEE